MPMSKQSSQKVLAEFSQYLAQAMRSEAVGQMHLQGSGAVALLEEKLKSFYGAKHALCVSNATSGLLAIALALDLLGADFVTTPYTYGGSIAGWLLLGNNPVFADIDPLTLTLDASAAQRKITPRTKALLAVDIFGNSSDTFALRRLADEHGLWYIADAAQSLGAFRDGCPASSLADAWVISFTTGKTVFAGEGGMILTNNTQLYEKLIWHTQHTSRQRRDLGFTLSNELAFNMRIHPLAAIWANALFEDSLRDLSASQLKNFELIRALNESNLIEPITFEEKGITPSYFRLTAAWKGKAKPRKLLASLRNYKFSPGLKRVPFALLYRQAAFISKFGSIRKETICPQAEHQAKKRFCLIH